MWNLNTDKSDKTHISIICQNICNQKEKISLLSNSHVRRPILPQTHSPTHTAFQSPISNATLITDASAIQQCCKSVPTLINVSHTWSLVFYLKIYFFSGLNKQLCYRKAVSSSITLSAPTTTTRCYWETGCSKGYLIRLTVGNFLCQTVLHSIFNKLYTYTYHNIL